MRPPPTVGPLARDPQTITPAGEYAHNDAVWVWRAGDWRAGQVTAVSAYAVQVRFELGLLGTGVDAMTAEYVWRRDQQDGSA